MQTEASLGKANSGMLSTSNGEQEASKPRKCRIRNPTNDTTHCPEDYVEKKKKKEMH